MSKVIVLEIRAHVNQPKRNPPSATTVDKLGDFHLEIVAPRAESRVRQDRVPVFAFSGSSSAIVIDQSNVRRLGARTPSPAGRLHALLGSQRVDEAG